MWAAVLGVNEDLLAQYECEALMVASDDEDGGKDGEGKGGLDANTVSRHPLSGVYFLQDIQTRNTTYCKTLYS